MRPVFLSRKFSTGVPALPVATAVFRCRPPVCPGQDIGVVVTGNKGRELIAMHWGFVPSWSREGAARQLINARAETVAQKTTFRDAFIHRRCLIPADGYYEWQKTGERKMPYLIVCPGIDIFAFAGIWNPWSDSFSCAILTTQTGKLAIHERMPLILTGSREYAGWLDGGDDPSPSDLLRPYSGNMVAYRVSSEVNSSRADHAGLIAGIDEG